MFNEEALDLLQRTAVRASGVVAVDTHKPQLAVPEGVVLKDIEHLQAGRSRFRGQYQTSMLAEFNSYTSKRHSDASGLAPAPAGTGSTSVFVNADGASATAFFNLGAPTNPGHGDDIAVLTLRSTAAHAALMAIIGKQMKQRQLAEFLEDWHDIVLPVYPVDDPNAPVPSLSAAIAAIRDITISAKAEQSSVQGDLSAGRTAIEEIEARSRKVLPTGFTFATEPYEGFLQRTFNLRLAVLPQEKDPLLTLRIVGHADVQEKIAKEFEQKVRDGVPTGVNVYRGTFAP